MAPNPLENNTTRNEFLKVTSAALGGVFLDRIVNTLLAPDYRPDHKPSGWEEFLGGKVAARELTDPETPENPDPIRSFGVWLSPDPIPREEHYSVTIGVKDKTSSRPYIIVVSMLPGHAQVITNTEFIIISRTKTDSDGNTTELDSVTLGDMPPLEDDENQQTLLRQHFIKKQATV